MPCFLVPSWCHSPFWIWDAFEVGSGRKITSFVTAIGASILHVVPYRPALAVLQTRPRMEVWADVPFAGPTCIRKLSTPGSRCTLDPPPGVSNKAGRGFWGVAPPQSSCGCAGFLVLLCPSPTVSLGPGHSRDDPGTPGRATVHLGELGARICPPRRPRPRQGPVVPTVQA